MYIVIMGSGRVGFNLAHLLIADGHDVTIIKVMILYAMKLPPNWML